MRFERWAARVVFLLGAPVLIATSAPPRWSDSRHFSQTVESQGLGHPKLVRISITLSAPVARDLSDLHVALTGHANRPASDIQFHWLINGVPVDPISGLPNAADAGLASDAGGLVGLLDAGAATPASDAGGVLPDFFQDVQPTGYEDGFLTLYSSTELPIAKHRCTANAPCDVRVEALIEAGFDSPYSLDLHADVELDGIHEKQPKGGFEVSMEVLDAP